MKTRNETKESMECTRGSKTLHSLEDTIVHKTENTQFDPVTGKKLATKIETSTHKTKQSNRTEEWEKVKLQRTIALTNFKKMTHKTAKIKSKVFAIYLDYISNALIDLETLRVKLKLSYQDSLWLDTRVVQLFVFGVTNDAHENREIPEYFQYLTCLWTWQELVAFGDIPHLIKNIENEYMLNKEETSIFLIRPAMVGYHTLGHLLLDHIPKLASIMRDKDYKHGKNFPSFKELIVPEDDNYPYATVVMQYSFTLYEPRLELQEKCAPFTLKDGQCAINVDGPLVRLFEQNLAEQIDESFTLLALKQ